MKWTSIKLIRKAIVKFKIAIVYAVIRYFPSFARAIVAREKKNLNEVSIAHHALLYSTDPVVTLNFFSQEMAFSRSVLWYSIVSVADAHTGWLTKLYNAHELVLDRELRLRILLKMYAFKEIEFSLDFSFLLGEYFSIICTSDKPSTLTSALSTLVVAKAPVEEVDSLLKEIGVLPTSLTEFQKVKFLTRLAQANEKNKFDYWKNKLEKSLSSPAVLKLSLLSASISYTNKISFSELEHQFLSLPYHISKKYKNDILYLYKEIPSSKNFLELRFSSDKRSQLSEFIVDAVGKNISLSYMRLGDGECYGMADQIHVDEQGVTRQELHWWGQYLDIALREELQNSFLHAVERADILGVPTVLRLIRDFNLVKRDAYPCNSLISRIFCVMKGASPFFENKVIVEDQSNLFLFDDDFINDIFRVANKVCVVSGVDTKLIERWAPDSEKLTCIEIPTHRLLRDGDIGSSVDGILPHVYKKYIDSIAFHAGPGVVFLVSAGFIGKIFIAEAASNGAVALDFGQALVSAVRYQEVSV
ncbi:hypothetical protein [Billgrantia montanilacus]|uniref:hypothetical protein n=1 Tax=Billgrantia montanilacus TaxID=2282305 RepID=UPI0011C01F82|nr:hypothetical protein [Halomonas montanilacus]